MTQLQIPKEQAIQILHQRLQELSAINFNPKVWQNRTVLDLKQIFGVLSDHWHQVQFIQFDTVVTSEKARILQNGRDTAKGLLLSYIDFIEQYSKADIAKQQESQNSYKEKYDALLQEWNEFIPLYNDLNKKYKETLSSAEIVKQDLRTAKNEIDQLHQNSLQLDNVTLKRLWKGVVNLPTRQVATILTFIIGIIAGVFAIGRLVERTGANNELFDLKTENSQLKMEKSKLEEQVKSKVTMERLK